MFSRLILGLFLLVFASGSIASNCPQFYPNQKEIVVPGTIELCNSFYVVRYSLDYKGPVLTSHQIHPSSSRIKRINRFHQDVRLKDSPKPSDYIGTGYDKGHMVPAGDAKNDLEMYDTFLMSNMTPQHPTLNRLTWRFLEDQNRYLAAEVNYPITSVTIAEYRSPNRLDSGELIPSGYWKVIFLKNDVDYYFAENIENGKVIRVDFVNFTVLTREEEK